MIIWKPGLRECVHAKSRSTKSGKTYNKVEKMEISKRKYEVNKKKNDNIQDKDKVGKGLTCCVTLNEWKGVSLFLCS